MSNSTDPEHPAVSEAQMRACPACGTYAREGSVPHKEATREAPLTSRLVHYEACPTCGLIGKYPMPSEEELKLYYGSAWQYESPRPPQTYWRAASFVASGLQDAYGTGKFPIKSGKMIGDGTILDVGSKGPQMAEEMGWHGWPMHSAGGLDAQPKSAGVGQAWLGSGEGKSAEHALVCAAHILEHVLYPNRFLEDLARLTAPGGFIYVEVPSLRAGVRDVGVCDDLNRNHLWHFSAMSLALLASQVGTLVAIETDFHTPGWPVERLLIKKTDPEAEALRALQLLQTDIICEYEKAAEKILMEHEENVGLYGCSHSYAQLVETNPQLLKYRVFDLYKQGGLYGLMHGPGRSRPIESPDAMRTLKAQKVYVTTRSYNSYLDIKRWLAQSCPWLLVETPYASLAEALGELPPVAAPR